MYNSNMDKWLKTSFFSHRRRTLFFENILLAGGCDFRLLKR